MKKGIIVVEKLSKTARSSMNLAQKDDGRRVCDCGEKMIATLVVRGNGQNGGMHWICPKCKAKVRIRR